MNLFCLIALASFSCLMAQDIAAPALKTPAPRHETPSSSASPPSAPSPSASSQSTSTQVSSSQAASERQNIPLTREEKKREEMDSLLKRNLALYRQMSSILLSVRDKASADAAATPLKGVLAESGKINAKLASLVKGKADYVSLIWGKMMDEYGEELQECSLPDLLLELEERDFYGSASLNRVLSPLLEDLLPLSEDKEEEGQGSLQKTDGKKIETEKENQQ